MAKHIKVKVSRELLPVAQDMCNNRGFRLYQSPDGHCGYDCTIDFFLCDWEDDEFLQSVADFCLELGMLQAAP